jgi:hypothetical protein
LPGPLRSFVFRETPYSDWAYEIRSTRFILYDNGTFALRYEASGHDYRGTYTESEGQILFTWANWPLGSATGTIDGDLLTVRYNEYLQMTDFVDAVYVLLRWQPSSPVAKGADAVRAAPDAGRSTTAHPVRVSSEKSAKRTAWGACVCMRDPRARHYQPFSSRISGSYH